MSDVDNLTTVESKWATVLEYAVLGAPAIIGVGLVIMLVLITGPLATDETFLQLMGIAYLGSILAGFVLTVMFAVSLYFDAKKVRAADVSWEPSPGLYGVGGFFLSGLVAWHYLYKRYEHTASPPAGGSWWYGVAASLVFVVVAVATTLLPVSLPGGILAAVGASATVLPIAIYKDAVHVRGGEGDWLPNPVNYFLAVFVGSFLVFVPVAVSGYYLYKRHKHVGVP